MAGSKSVRKTKKRVKKTPAKWKGVHPSKIPPGSFRGQNPHVYDSAGKDLGKFSRKAAKLVARVVGGSVGKPKPTRNPLPVGKFVPVFLKRTAHGIQVFARGER